MTDIKLSGRRHDLDALRVLCFGTLIIYHTSLAYGTKPWLVNSVDGNRLFELIGAASHPWRMSLLFFISGLVTRSLLRSRSIEEIRRSRTRQLLLPFALGVVLLVPPQIYLSDSNPAPELSYWEFWKFYMVHGLRLEHLWFLAYLWIYVFAWSFLWPCVERVWPSLPSKFASWLQGVNFFLLPIVFFSVLRLSLYPIFSETLVINNDIYAHLLYFSMFIAGSLLAGEPSFWRDVDRRRWVSLAVALVSYLIVATAVVAAPREEWPEALVVLVRIARSVFQWCAIIALLGFAGRIANRPNRVISFLNRSMMTYYVVHQTVIIIVAYYISQMGMLDIRSFVPVILITAAICAVIAEAQKLLMTYIVPLISKVVTLIRPVKPSTSGAAAD